MATKKTGTKKKKSGSPARGSKKKKTTTKKAAAKKSRSSTKTKKATTRKRTTKTAAKKSAKKKASKATPKVTAKTTKKKATKAQTAAPVKVRAKPKKKGRGGRKCHEEGCSQPQLSDGYCRLHYIKNWQEIIQSRKMQARKNLNKYIESISERYPEDFMDRLRDDLGNDSKFKNRLRELGFREEYESGSENPFQAENLNEFVDGLKFDE